MRYIRKEKAELELQGIPTLRGQAEEMDPIKEIEKEYPGSKRKSHKRTFQDGGQLCQTLPKSTIR